MIAANIAVARPGLLVPLERGANALALGAGMHASDVGVQHHAAVVKAEEADRRAHELIAYPRAAYVAAGVINGAHEFGRE